MEPTYADTDKSVAERAEPSRRPPMVTEGLMRLERVQDETNALLTALYERTACARVDDNATTRALDVDARPNASDLSNVVECRISQAQAINQRIAALLESIDL